MPKLEVVAREIYYARKAYKTGDTFEASENDAKLFKAIGKAKDAATEAPKPATRKRNSYETRTMTSDASVQSAVSDAARYLRRDMRSED